MGRDAVTAEQVNAAADELQRNGAKPTVRAVRHLLGDVGSMGTITKLVQQWRLKTGETGEAGPRLLPSKVQRAVFDFLDQEVARVHTDFVEELQEARREVRALADNNDNLVEQLKNLQAELAVSAKEKAAQEGRILQLLNELQGARDEVAVLRRHVETERVALAVARHRVEKLQEIETELQRLRTDLETQRDARVDAERKVAVLQAQKSIVDAYPAQLNFVPEQALDHANGVENR
jgi:DNA repair exonuclease SbcCD ATPase subunit